MKAKNMDASHLLIILSEQEALRLGLNSISVDIPTTLSKITLAKAVNIPAFLIQKLKILQFVRFLFETAPLYCCLVCIFRICPV